MTVEKNGRDSSFYNNSVDDSKHIYTMAVRHVQVKIEKKNLANDATVFVKLDLEVCNSVSLFPKMRRL